MLAYVLLGYLIGQILPFEGRCIERSLTAGCILFLSFFLALFPMIGILSLIRILEFDNLPTLTLAVSLVYSIGIYRVIRLPTIES